MVRERFRGPLGLWDFPLLNRLSQIIRRRSKPDSLEEKLERQRSNNGSGSDGEEEYEKTFQVVRDSNGEVTEVKVSKVKK